jgi:hypothetical protein
MTDVEVDFSTAQEAASAYYGETDDSGGTETDDTDTDGTTTDPSVWGGLQTASTDWVANWTLAYQEHQEQPRTRWFVFRIHPETDEFQALRMTGSAKTYPGDTPPAELPHTPREQEARDAYQTWLDENQPDEQDEDEQDEGWGEWQKVTQLSDWTIWGREASESDAVEFVAASTRKDGSAVYLAPGGELVEEAHVYSSMDAVKQAVAAYKKRLENGEIDEDDRPTGRSPGRGEIEKDTKGAGGGPLGGLIGAMGGTGNAAVVAVGAGAGLYLLESKGYTNLTETI